MTPPASSRVTRASAPIDSTGRQPDWYKDALIYEVHVRAFQDSNGDGIGDFRGLISRLDYIHDLGVTAIWLLPFYPSPLRDDGYDTADYRQIHPSYGTLRDFRAFLRAAHDRGLRVITELVLNHTSDQHPWFQRARRARPGSKARDFYVWNDTPDKYTDARIIFKDFETSNWTWDPVAEAYFWHRFYSHQPDLNFENPEVQKALFRIVDYWLEMGVDGLRLDAVPYLFEREGTNCENLPETHRALRELRAHIDEKFEDRMLLAEANQWPEEAVDYFGDGDECHMAFHFPVMPRMFMAIRQEDRFPIIDILTETPAIPESSQWAIFLRNHDELTLEMVTDEERDYMYRVYADDPQARINLGIRHRLAPLLGNDRRLIEMMNGLLLSLPGTPVIYYGDEIGMGDNIYLGDRDGVRTPMQWSQDRNAGFSAGNPQKLYLPVVIDPEYHASAVNVESQQANPQSLLWWMRRLIALRKRHDAFGRGEIEFLLPENRKVLTFLRTLRRRAHPGRREPLALRAVRRARPLALPGHDAGRDARRRRVPAHRRAALPADARAARLLLVLARAAGRRAPPRAAACPSSRCAATGCRSSRARAAARCSRRSCRPGCARAAGSARSRGACARRRSRTRSASPIPRTRADRRSATSCSCAPSTPRATARPTSSRSRPCRSTRSSSSRRRRSRCCTAATATSCCTSRCTSRASRVPCST